MDKVTVVVHDITGQVYDMEIPLDITAADLIAGLHAGLKHPGPCPASMRSDNPIAFLTGDRLLSGYGLRDGSNLYFYDGEGRV